MRVEAGFLKINGGMKSTLCIALQTNFEIICTLKCMVYCLPYYWADHLATITEIQKVKNTYTPVLFSNNNITEVNRVYTEQKIK